MSLDKPLPSRYHQRVQKILDANTLPRYKKKKHCKLCQGKRYSHIDKENKLVACPRCVNLLEAKKDWEILENEIRINTI